MTDVTAEGPAPAATTARRSRSSIRVVVEWVAIVAITLLVGTLLKTYVVEPYFIPSPSMSPTLRDGDWILVDKLSYDFGHPSRGNIVVFSKPPDDIDPGVTDLVKRVIGLPGQTIESQPNGSILIDGRTIRQPWLTAFARAHPGPAIPLQVIPRGDYFMMGDNRDNSDDSRFFGPVPGRLIIGRAVGRIWPVSRLHWF